MRWLFLFLNIIVLNSWGFNDNCLTLTGYEKYALFQAIQNNIVFTVIPFDVLSVKQDNIGIKPGNKKGSQGHVCTETDLSRWPAHYLEKTMTAGGLKLSFDSSSLDIACIRGEILKIYCVAYNEYKADVWLHITMTHQGKTVVEGVYPGYGDCGKNLGNKSSEIVKSLQLALADAVNLFLLDVNSWIADTGVSIINGIKSTEKSWVDLVLSMKDSLIPESNGVAVLEGPRPVKEINSYLEFNNLLYSNIPFERGEMFDGPTGQMFIQVDIDQDGKFLSVPVND
jgi:hypothetical protein